YTHLHPFPTRRSSDLEAGWLLHRRAAKERRGQGEGQGNDPIPAIGRQVGHCAASGKRHGALYPVASGRELCSGRLSAAPRSGDRSEEHTSELQSRENL